MDKSDLVRLRNEIGCLDAVEGDEDDNIAIALASYYETRPDRPEGDQIDEEVGWSAWAIEKTSNALNRIVAHLVVRLKGEGEDAARD